MVFFSQRSNYRIKLAVGPGTALMFTCARTWRSRARPRRSGSVSFGFRSLSLYREPLDYHKGEESLVRQMQ